MVLPRYKSGSEAMAREDSETEILGIFRRSLVTVLVVDRCGPVRRESTHGSRVQLGFVSLLRSPLRLANVSDQDTSVFILDVRHLPAESITPATATKAPSPSCLSLPEVPKGYHLSELEVDGNAVYQMYADEREIVRGRMFLVQLVGGPAHRSAAVPAQAGRPALGSANSQETRGARLRGNMCGRREAFQRRRGSVRRDSCSTKEPPWRSTLVQKYPPPSLTRVPGKRTSTPEQAQRNSRTELHKSPARKYSKQSKRGRKLHKGKEGNKG